LTPPARAADRVYHALYRGVLARLPERTAVALGQAALRRIPLDRLSLFRNDDPRLAITLGGVRLPNPIILTSMYYDTRILARAMGLGFGAVTAKSITRLPRPGHPEPNLVRLDSPAGPGLVNCNGFHNPGLAAYRREIATLPHRVPLIVAAAGESIEEYVEVVQGLEAFGDLVEINISSPNTRLVYEWSQKPSELRRLFEAVRRVTRRPVIVKISPDFHEENLRAIVPAALDAGIGIVNYGNTRRIEEPRLSQRAGGLSGPAIFPAMLENVRSLRARFGAALEIIATGGIHSPETARQALAAGATACGYFTAFITEGPFLARRILDGLLAGRK
jgi:dihydroorotate dehydrogenase